MFKLSRLSIFSAALILALLFSAFPLGAVMAESEDPAQPETPVIEEPPALPEETPQTVEEVIAEAPEGIVVVPVDPGGEPMPMAEEATANSYVTGDPMYCPQNVPFGDPDQCIHYLTIDEAINKSMTTDYGTVYVEVDYADSNPAPILIDGSSGPGPLWQFNLIGGVDIATGEIVGRTKLTRQVVVTNLHDFNMENFSITVQEPPQPEFEDAAILQPAALVVNTDGRVSISDSDFDDNPGSGIAIVAGDTVSLFNVQANNNGAGNYVSSGYNGLYLTHSRFNNNLGTGLVAYSGTDIFMICSQALNNTGIDTQFPEIGAGGMYLEAPGEVWPDEVRYGNITVWCSKASGNDSYGLVANAGGTIYTATNKFGNNGLIDFVPLSPNDVVEQTAPCSEICPSCSGGTSGGEEEKPSEGNTQVVIVKVGEGDGTAEIKPGYSTVFKLFDQERLVQLTALTSGSAPSGSSAVYTPLDESTLPAPLPEGTSLIPWGFNLTLTNPDGTSVESLIGYMLVRFYLPEGFMLPGGMRLVIQYFDPETSSWTPMSTAMGGGTAFTYASKPGTYVLTTVPIE